MILSQQVILNFCQMGQGWRYRPQESWYRISHVAQILSSCLSFSDELRPLVLSNCSFTCPPIRIIRHAEITICQNQIWNFLLNQDHILFSFNLSTRRLFHTTIVYILQSSKRLYPPPSSRIFNPGHFNYCSGADRVN